MRPHATMGWHNDSPIDEHSSILVLRLVSSRNINFRKSNGVKTEFTQTIAPGDVYTLTFENNSMMILNFNLYFLISSIEIYDHRLPVGDSWCISIVARKVSPIVITKLHTAPFFLNVASLQDLLKFPLISPLPVIGNKFHGLNLQVCNFILF